MMENTIIKTMAAMSIQKLTLSPSNQLTRVSELELRLNAMHCFLDLLAAVECTDAEVAFA